MITQIFSDDSGIYTTSDLALSSMLALFLPIEGIDKQNPRKAYWIFKRSQELDDLVKQYYRKELRVEPSAYFESITFIKNMLYSEDLNVN